MKLLITGPPGVGKSTIIEHLIARAPSSCFWVHSKELRDSQGQRIGFEASTSTGKQAVFAHKQTINSEHLIGDYKVDRQAIDNLFTNEILQALANCQDLIVIDEIGRMEMLSNKFEAAIDKLFDSKADVIATIRFEDEWTKKYINLPGVEVITVTNRNRDSILATLLTRTATRI